MEFKALKCDLCGGDLIMDNSREFAKCEFCGTKYMKSVLKQIIQEIKGTVNVEGAVETTVGDAEKERILKNADSLAKIGEADKALAEFTKITIDYPEDIRGWEGLLKIIVYYGICTPDKDEKIARYYKNEIKELSSAFNRYAGICKKLNKDFNVKYYYDTFFNNLYAGRLIYTFRHIDEETDIAKEFSGIFAQKELDIIRNDSVYYAKALVSLGEEYILDNFAPVNQDENSVYKYKERPYFFFGRTLVTREYVYDSYFYNVYTTKKAPDKKLTDDYDAYLNNVRATRRAKGNCQHCGGRFKGMMKKVCSVCDKPKDY